jgi:APA family basic amino acid/polyamine antiporter
MQEENQDDFKRELGIIWWNHAGLGSMIGSGIFIVSSDMVRQVGSADGWSPCGCLLRNYRVTLWVMANWVLCSKAGNNMFISKRLMASWLGFIRLEFLAAIQTGTTQWVWLCQIYSRLFPVVSDKNIPMSWEILIWMQRSWFLFYYLKCLTKTQCYHWQLFFVTVGDTSSKHPNR